MATKQTFDYQWVGRRMASWCLAGVLAAGAGCGRRPDPEASETPETPVVETYEETREVRMESHGLSVQVIEVQPGVFEMTVGPGGAEAGGGGSAGAISLDAVTGGVTLRRRGEVFWEGSVAALEGFGRAAQPGVSVKWRAGPDEALYGLGERFDSLDQSGRRVEMWIQDQPGQGDGSASYVATPVLFSSRGYALFAADNPEGWFELNPDGSGWHRYDRAGRQLKLWVVAGEHLRELAQTRAAVIGGLRGAPDWVWGPWISRNSYENQSEAEEAIEGMVARGIPVGVIVQEAWKGTSDTGEYNTFSRDRWPELDRFLDRCEELGIRNVLWQVPILHPSSPHFREAEARGYFVRDPEGRVRLRRHWMEGFGNLDFTNPDAVAFWQDVQRPLLAKKTISGFKADDGEDIQPDDVFHDGRRGWQMHNEYSYLYAQALTDLMDQEGVEGFLWARSGSVGMERVPGLWAGDQFATWPQMASLIPAGLSAGLSGAPFWGHDIGGYIGDPGPELYVRWAQFGAFSPLMQYHGIEPREPWRFGEGVADIYKKLAHLRMNLRPLWIALGREAAATGLPIMRPMAMEFPEDARFLREQTQYMIGSDLLVAPVLEPGAGRRVRFPAGVWQHLLDPVSFTGPADIDVAIAEGSVPVFVREGAELPVELDEDAELGQWREGAARRRLAFGPERVVLRRLEAPHAVRLGEEHVRITTRVPVSLLNRLVVETRLGAEEPATRQGLRMRHGIAFADLKPGDRTPRAGERQEYRLYLRSEEPGGPDRLLFAGQAVWYSPVQADIEWEGSRYVREGRKNIRVTLRNPSSEPAPASVRLEREGGVRVQPLGRSIQLPPGSERTLIWSANFGGEIEAERRIRVHVISGGSTLATSERTFPHPWRWIVAGPFMVPIGEGHRTPLPPEERMGPEVRFETAEGVLRWWALDEDHAVRNDGLDFNEAFGPREHAVAYALTKIRSDREQDAVLWMGSDDTLTVWVNGELVHVAEVYRPLAPDQDRVEVRLAKGVNILLAKVAQATGDWGLHVRVTAPNGGRITGLSDGFDDFEAYDPNRPEFQPLPPATDAEEEAPTVGPDEKPETETAEAGIEKPSDIHPPVEPEPESPPDRPRRGFFSRWGF